MFNDDLNTIKSVLKSIGSEINDDYDGFIVKAPLLQMGGK